MIARISPAVSTPMPKAGPANSRAQHRDIAERSDQERLHVSLQIRREHEQAPDAVDDAGDAGQEARSRYRSGVSVRAGKAR